jgi:DNA-binding winged helix-turn-helix (wHTH) protein
MLTRFGEFELDERMRRLSRGGQPVRLAGQPFDLLCLLVNRPDELVTREEIRQHLWPDSNVEFEHSLDVLVNRLRAVLGDTGKGPFYIATVPKRGYRFLAPVRVVPGRASWEHLAHPLRRIWTYAVVALLAGAMAILFAHTRYDKFIPRDRSHAPPSSLPASK